MRLNLFSVLTLCIWLGQICEGSDKSIIEQFIRDKVYAVGEQFVEDLVNIGGKYQNNSFIQDVFGGTLYALFDEISKEKNSKIDVNQVKYFSSNDGYSSAIENVVYDHLRVSQLVLSKQFPPERYNGIINLIFVYTFENATTEEIQSALNYLYGNDTESTKTSFLDSHNFPKPTIPLDNAFLQTSNTAIQLYSYISSLAIREKFPCNELALRTLKRFVYIIQRLDGDKSEINACMIKESPGNWEEHWHSLYNSKAYMEYDLAGSKSILSTRLPDETIRGIINFKRATIPDTPIDEIEKALEYLYEDVTKIDCPATEISTLKVE